MYQAMDSYGPQKLRCSVGGWRKITLSLGDHLNVLINPEELQDLRELVDLAAARYALFIDEGQPETMLHKSHYLPDHDDV